ncbi:MAG: hypothetical protein SVY10_10245 [Thermodesulfobacteriota bacterium]|nr:hypothetical protein [Thermodesulfobacteriota bacterium]
MSKCEQTHSMGTVTLMGSGEMTSSMVKVHGEILERIKERPIKAIFLDTPAGFQLNADLLSEKARDYFETRFQVKLEPVLFKSFPKATPLEMAEVAHMIMNAHFIFAGPGSPTYALKNWLGNPVGDAIQKTINLNSHLVFASAASICVGRYSIPVYEIYKVGENPFWVEGLDFFGKIGLDIAVIPHWNNTEGGNHDTRFCYMGEPRLRILQDQLPESTTILGLDEHTACIMDLDKRQCFVKGVGGVTVLKNKHENVYLNGSTFGFHELLPLEKKNEIAKELTPKRSANEPLITRIVELEEEFFKAVIDKSHSESIFLIPQEFLRIIHDAKRAGDASSSLYAAYERLIDMHMKLAEKVMEVSKRDNHLLASIIEYFVTVRNELRQKKEWNLADKIREELGKLGIQLEDHKEKTLWNFNIS